MRHRTLKLGLVAATALRLRLPLLVATQSAYADYAPSTGDVVGVGADTSAVLGRLPGRRGRLRRHRVQPARQQKQADQLRRHG